MILTHWHPDHIGGVGTCTASVGGVMKSAEVNSLMILKFNIIHNRNVLNLKAHQNKRICLQMVSQCSNAFDCYQCLKHLCQLPNINYFRKVHAYINIRDKMEKERFHYQITTSIPSSRTGKFYRI